MAVLWKCYKKLGKYCFATCKILAAYGVKSTQNSTENTTTHKWWGDASGPYHDQGNPGGTGNFVSDNVDFKPWCTNEGCTEHSEE